MQQPPLSQQIRALEREVDATLFVRHPRGVTLTDAGRAFLKDAESILSEVEHAKLFKQALGELDAWKPAGKEFMVCLICGYTVISDPTLLKCPVCAAPKEKFTIIK